MNRSFGVFLVHASLIVLTAVGLPIFFLMEVLLGEPISLSSYLRFGAVWVALLLIRVGLRLQRSHLALLVAMLCLLTILYVTPWSTRKPFLRQFNRIQEGMTRQEVILTMEGYSHSGSEGKWYFRPRPSRRFDSDWGEVYFKGDLVSKVFFSPD